MGVISFLKRFVRAVVPHIIVISLLFGYLAFGAAVFSFLEDGHSDLLLFTTELKEIKNKFMGTQVGHSSLMPALDFGNVSVRGDAGPGAVTRATPAGATGTADPAEFEHMVDELMDYSLRPEWKVGRMQAVQSERAWSFASSMLFCLTTITTIGYGDVVPVTVAGKVFCVIYSVFGIPLTMLYMAGVGSFLARLILTLCKILNLGQPIRKAVCPCGSQNKKGPCDGAELTKKRDRSSRKKMNANSHEPVPDEKGPSSENGEPVAEMPIVTTQHGMESAQPRAGRTTDDEMEAPVLLVAAIMVGYMCAGAFMMSQIEEWTYGEALYFTFISLTTIGFGDYVPTKLYEANSFFVCIIYALIGLAVMSMCIALVQAKARRLGSRAWECIGF